MTEIISEEEYERRFANRSKTELEKAKLLYDLMKEYISNEIKDDKYYLYMPVISYKEDYGYYMIYKERGSVIITPIGNDIQDASFIVFKEILDVVVERNNINKMLKLDC